jgi:hypothetical protein
MQPNTYQNRAVPQPKNKMNIIQISEVVLILVSIWVLATQVILPMWSNIPIFPKFRNRGKLEEELRKAREEAGDEMIRREIKKTKPKNK